MNWKRAVGYGLVLWAIPFAVSFFLFPVREANRPLFESAIAVIGVTVAVIATLRYFRDVNTINLGSGPTIGFVWAAISVLIDLPIFLLVFKMDLLHYLADVALTYLAFPAIATGIALARRDGAMSAVPPQRG
jgi:hypothetical protein